MPRIKFDAIADKSSEDATNQLFANNLLRIKDFKSWKCKEWEESAFVILELKEPQKIETIEIGNDCSAFIEVLVANSSDPKPRFQVLLSTSSFMTPSDKFPKDKLSPNARTEKWDRFKIVCKQPFNREISYGLAFVRFNSLGDNDEEIETIATKTNFGPFRLRSADNEGNESDPNSGSFFARRTNQFTDSPNVPKRTSLASAVGLSSNSPKTRETKQNSSDSSVKSKPNASQTAPNILQKASISPLPSSSSANRQSSPSPPKRVRKVTENKPFNQIMSGVVFALSGFVNPKRSEIRDKAMKMGAKYRPDWDQSCTHLICAFANTPKFNEVKSQKGRIVTENWIYHSFNQKKLLSYKRYTLGQTSDDEEEEDNDMEEDEDYVPPVLNSRKRIQYIDDDDEDESQIKEVIGFQPNSIRNEPQIIDNDMNEEIYDMETDESSGADNNNTNTPSINNCQQNQSSVSQTKDIFKGKCFCLFGPFEDKEKQLLTEYIISHYGKLEESLSDKVKYVVTNSEWNEVFEEACLSNESLVFVKPKWILKCHQNSKLIPFQPFIVSANY